MSKRYQVLVAALNADDLNLYKNMHLSSDAVIVNQCSDESIHQTELDGRKATFVHSRDRGVGKSRNLAVRLSDADIIEFADDDMIFVKDHEAIVSEEFSAHPEADLIVFSLESLNPERPLLKIHQFSRIGKRKAMKYGCARIAVRREKLSDSRILFSEYFGGGAKYGSGEDTIFLTDCLKAGLRLYESPRKVADVRQDTSTWFKGYNEKYYRDKGALFAAVFPVNCYAYAGLTALKRKDGRLGRIRVFKLYTEGIREYKKQTRNLDRRKAAV